MKEIIFRLCRWMLALLGFSAISSCVPKVEYGTPHCNYQIKCKVVDSQTGKTVKGVHIEPGFMETDMNDNKVSRFIMFHGPVLTENPDGSTSMTGERGASYGDFDEAYIRVTDPDPATDGHYKDSIYFVPLQKTQEGERWNQGTWSADVTLKAEKVED